MPRCTWPCHVLNLCRSEADHVEVSASRIRRDVSDLHKVITYLCQNSPFRFSDEDKLISLSSGVVADETVNCDNADEIGFEIQSRWDNKKFGEMKLSKSDQVRTFATVVHTCSVGNETIAMDPNSLFHRLIVMAERCGDIRGCFAYERLHIRCRCLSTDI